MKNRIILLLTLLLFLIIPFKSSSASSDTYSINNVDIKAVMNEDGSIDVTETLNYSFNGNFNGIYRDYPINLDCDYNIKKVTIEDSSGKNTVAEKNDSESNNSYQIIQDSSNTRMKLFTKSNDESKKITIQYTLTSPYIPYLSEDNLPLLNWSFYSVEDNSTVKNLSLDLSLNNTILSSENSSYHIYCDSETATEYNDGHILVNVKNLNSVLGIELKLPTNYITRSLPSKAESSDFNNYTDNDEINPIFLLIPISIVAAIIIIPIITINNNTRKFNEAVGIYRSGFIFNTNPICIDPPSDLPPALVNILVNDGHLTSNMIIPTLLYLADLGYYSVKEVIIHQGYSNKIKKDLKFTLSNQGTAPKEEHLKYFIGWFNKYSKNGSFELLEIKQLLSTYSVAQEFKGHESTWESLAKDDATELMMFYKINNKTILSNEALEEKYRWLAYEKHLTSIMNNNNIDDLSNANKILAYALALDIPTSYIDNFSKYLNNNTTDSTDHNFYLYYYYPIFFSNMHTIQNEASNSSSFDSSGGFTGISSGGDFSGGGGGGGGAF